jgi:hypothetical protein
VQPARGLRFTTHGRKHGFQCVEQARTAVRVGVDERSQLFADEPGKTVDVIGAQKGSLRAQHGGVGDPGARVPPAGRRAAIAEPRPRCARIRQSSALWVPRQLCSSREGHRRAARPAGPPGVAANRGRRSRCSQVRQHPL